MKLEIHVYHHHVADEEVLRLLHAIDERTKLAMTDLSRITTEVTEISTAVDSAVQLLGELAQLIRDNATDPEALNELADTLDAKGTALAEAVVANTPSNPEPPTP